MKFLHLPLLIVLTLNLSQVKGQDFKCGTKLTPAYQQLLSQQQASKVTNIQNFTDCVNKTYSLNIIIVTDSLNNVGGGSISSAVNTLNAFFDSICMSFKVCNIDTVYAYKYYRWEDTTDEPEFVVNYCKQNVINIALVGKIISPAGHVGYAPLPTAPVSAPAFDLIVVEESSFSGMTVVHEFGHYFGLLHTFETGTGIEFVDGSNCQTAGDMFCDTPADIDPAPIGPGCVWTGSNTDPNGDYYTPLLGNMMSYHTGCPIFFTAQQYNFMAFVALNWRTYLY